MAAYVLAFAAGLLPFGRFGDRFGRQRLFLLGIGLFTLASALCGFAQSMPMLIRSRALQGIGGAMMVPQVMAIMHVIFPPDQKARAFALAGLVASLGAVTGPLLGGALITGDIAGLDWIGVALFSLAVVLVVLPVIEGALLGWPWWCVAMLAAALPTGALFVWRQVFLSRRNRAQLLPVGLMRNGGFLSGVAMVMLHFSAIPGMFLVLAIHLQAGFGLDPLHSGMATAPCPLGVMLGSHVTGRFATKGLSVRMTIGVSVMLAGMIWLRHVAGDHAGAMAHALVYQLGVFAAILAILALRGRVRGKADQPPRRDRVSGR